MFRGGDYIDKASFADHINKPGHNYLDVSDIPGARPKKHFQTRSSQQQLGQVGASIIDNNQMIPAGVKKAAK